ncbi:uncharacterized protein TNCV_4578291 [Trichonephila clavipes]|nr:uncharacterized protein TNCV_4578291 [Trichonephila clavipes]
MEDSSDSPPGIIGRPQVVPFSIKADRVVQTTISRLASGHIRGLSFNLGQKIYENCTKCNLVQATPDHLLFCAGLEREDIYSSPLLVYDFLRTLGLMDLV